MCFPRARRRTKVFFSLSYHNVASGQYHQGWDDIYFIIFWITVITGLRVAVMEYLLQPIASWGGIRKTKAKMRFTEQAWMLIYFTCSWCFGMVCDVQRFIETEARSEY